MQLFDSLHYMADTIHLSTSTRHAGVLNLIINNYVGVVQHVLHHNPQQCYLSASMFAIGLALNEVPSPF